MKEKTVWKEVQEYDHKGSRGTDGTDTFECAFL